MWKLYPISAVYDFCKTFCTTFLTDTWQKPIFLTELDIYLNSVFTESHLSPQFNCILDGFMGLPLRWYTSSQRKIWLILVVATLKEDGDIFKYITQRITEVTTIPKADSRFSNNIHTSPQLECPVRQSTHEVPWTKRLTSTVIFDGPMIARVRGHQSPARQLGSTQKRSSPPCPTAQPGSE